MRKATRTCGSLLIAVCRSTLASEADANVSANVDEEVKDRHHLNCIVREVCSDELPLLLQYAGNSENGEDIAQDGQVKHVVHRGPVREISLCRGGRLCGELSGVTC